MHKIKWLVLATIGLLLLAACGADEAAPATEAPIQAPPPTAVAEPTPIEAAVAKPAPSAGETVNGYSNVIYTQNDADVIGKTEKAQLLNVYATW